MPSKDPINPKANAWMSSDPERRSVTVSADHGATASTTASPALSATVIRLARRLGKTPEEVAAQIPEDTLRRTKYPVIETVNKDGTRSFEHDLGIQEARIPLVYK